MAPPHTYVAVLIFKHIFHWESTGGLREGDTRVLDEIWEEVQKTWATPFLWISTTAVVALRLLIPAVREHWEHWQNTVKEQTKWVRWSTSFNQNPHSSLLQKCWQVLESAHMIYHIHWGSWQGERRSRISQLSTWSRAWSQRQWPKL